MKHLLARRFPTWKNIKHAIQNKSGSEALEMVYATASLCMLIMSTLLILGYALQVNAVSFAGKRVARYVEVSGKANETELQGLLENLLDNADEINADVDVVNVSSWYNYSQRKIQLRETFTIRINAVYELNLINPGGKWEPIPISIPIQVSVNGQSEIYWKD